MKILLALDLSAGSAVAVDEVLIRPWPVRTTVDVVGVADTQHLSFTPDVVDEILGRMTATVNSAVQRLKDAGLIPTPRIVSGDARTMIVEHANEMGADLVVLGAHSAKGISGFLLGSVAKAVLRMAHCSVEVARHTHRSPDQQGMRVLLAADESDYSTAAARAMDERGGTGAHTFASGF
jgi:nucleotide-binding universal stress UspA family protein